MKQMLALGEFVFSLSKNTPYEGLSRTSDGGFVTVPRYNGKPFSQNTGQGLENITLTGTWFKYQGMQNMQALRELQKQLKPIVLSDGYGINMGLWTIKSLSEKQDRIIDDGTAQTNSFTIALEEFVDEES